MGKSYIFTALIYCLLCSFTSATESTEKPAVKKRTCTQLTYAIELMFKRAGDLSYQQDKDFSELSDAELYFELFKRKQRRLKEYQKKKKAFQDNLKKDLKKQVNFLINNFIHALKTDTLEQFKRSKFAKDISENIHLAQIYSEILHQESNVRGLISKKENQEKEYLEEKLFLIMESRIIQASFDLYMEVASYDIMKAEYFLAKHGYLLERVLKSDESDEDKINAIQFALTFFTPRTIVSGFDILENKRAELRDYTFLFSTLFVANSSKKYAGAFTLKKYLDIDDFTSNEDLHDFFITFHSTINQSDLDFIKSLLNSRLFDQRSKGVLLAIILQNKSVFEKALSFYDLKSQQSFLKILTDTTLLKAFGLDSKEKFFDMIAKADTLSFLLEEKEAPVSVYNSEGEISSLNKFEIQTSPLNKIQVEYLRTGTWRDQGLDELEELSSDQMSLLLSKMNSNDTEHEYFFLEKERPGEISYRIVRVKL